ncbi:MAG: hypothetical protein AAFP19_03855 [Bacteroidota bacterium]
MRRLFIISLLSLVLLPIVWNGAGLLHHIVDHTHIFCLTDHEHEHQSSHECSSICHLNQDKPNDHVPATIEFYELKQYVTDYAPIGIQPVSIAFVAIDEDLFLNQGRLFSNDIFHPPIC